MRIGEMASNMMMISKNQMHFMKSNMIAQKEIATGKRVNSAADDPSSIHRIQRLKGTLNEINITKSNLDQASFRNQAMESSLNEMGNMANDLLSLSIQYEGFDPDKQVIETQATAILDNMVSIQANTSYNGSNPFTDGKSQVRLTGGNTITINSPKFQITKNSTNPSNYDITLNDGTKLENQSVSDILSSDFIQENFSNQISEAKASIGINDRILETRKNIESRQEEVLTKALSNIEDADLAKSSINLNITSQMVNLNQALLLSSSNQFQQYTGMIFNVTV